MFQAGPPVVCREYPDLRSRSGASAARRSNEPRVPAKGARGRLSSGANQMCGRSRLTAPRSSKAGEGHGAAVLHAEPPTPMRRVLSHRAITSAPPSYRWLEQPRPARSLGWGLPSFTWACPRYCTAVPGNRPKVRSSRQFSHLGPKPAKRPTTKPFRWSAPLSSDGRMNSAGSCVPGGSNRKTRSPIVTMTKDASGLRFIVSNRKVPPGAGRARSQKPPDPILQCAQGRRRKRRRRTSPRRTEALRPTHEIVYVELHGARMHSRRLDCCRRRIDAGDRRATRRQGFRHEPTTAAEIKHPLARPVADEGVEEGKPRGHHVPQRPQPARIVAPPVRRGAIDRQVVLGAGRDPGEPVGNLAGYATNASPNRCLNRTSFSSGPIRQ